MLQIPENLAKPRRGSLLADFRLWTKARNEKKRWHFKYAIKGPKSRRFLPSDEALRAMVARLPRIKFVKCERMPDHDILILRGVEDNIFRSIADSSQKKLRRRFLRELGRKAASERPPIRSGIASAAERFLNECDFANTEWTGEQLVSYTKDGYRYEGRQTLSGPYALPIQRFTRICRGELPFFYAAAQQ